MASTDTSPLVVEPTIAIPSGPTYSDFRIGDRLPLLAQRIGAMEEECNIDAFAGRYIVLCFYGSAADPRGRAAIDAVERHRSSFDEVRAVFFGVSIDPADETENRVQDDFERGIRFLFDFDYRVSRTCGAFPQQAPIDGALSLLRRVWMIIDPMLHVLAIIPFSKENADELLFAYLEGLPPPAKYGGIEIPAPIIIIPNVFEASLCRQLINLFEADGGRETGVMRGDKHVLDSGFKRRRDYVIKDQRLIGQLQNRIVRRVTPDIERLFFMKITRMERYIVSCYDSKDQAHFSPHRDNRQRLTAHRRFAISINLNGGFEGGQVIFPEYNMRGYRAPPGWAVVFPCNILHAVEMVTSGKRYAFLPFVYDEEGRKIMVRT